MNRRSKIKMALQLMLLLVVLYTVFGLVTVWYSESKTTEMADYVASLDLQRMALLADDRLEALPDSSFDRLTVGSPALDTILGELRSAELNPDICVELWYKPQDTLSSGRTSYDRFDQSWLCYYTPLRHHPWVLAISASEDTIYGEVHRIEWGMLANFVLGLLILAYICYRLFRRIEQFEKVAAQDATIRGELFIASSLQRGMLPDRYPAFPAHPEVDVCGLLIPAKEVGGDLYDYFLRDDQLFICIGDVSGKGVPASIYMAVICSLFRNITQHQTSPAKIAGALNLALSERNEQNMFCTMIIGVLDLKTGHLRFCNCGHNLPVVRRLTPDGKVDVRFAHMKTNIAIGILPGFDFEEEQTDLAPGEGMFCYTDGITEAESHSKELYGEQRLLSALLAATNAHLPSAKDLIDDIYADVERFAEPDYQSDDITMLTLEYKGF